MEGNNWSILFENKTVNENYSNFLSILNEVCDKHIPTKTVVISPDDKPFMNNSIRKAIRKRNHIHYRAKSTNNPDHWSQYRHLRNDVIRLVREAKTEYKNKLTSQLMDKSIPPDKW
jgi:predicted RNA-binding protein with RPS1 domain